MIYELTLYKLPQHRLALPRLPLSCQMAIPCKKMRIPRNRSRYPPVFLTLISQSPSIYIGFSSLSAFDYCGVVGQPFTNITVGFDPDELSTIVFAPSGSQTDTDVDTANGGVFTTTETLTFYTPVGSAALNTKDLERDCSTILGYNYIPGNPSNALKSSRMF